MANPILVIRKKVAGVRRFDDPDIFIHIRMCRDCEDFKFIKSFAWNVKGRQRYYECCDCRSVVHRRRREQLKEKSFSELVSMKW